MNRNDGRFNPDSDTPQLTPDEDANDFQLVAEILPDNSEIERRKRREAEEKAKKNTPDLFPPTPEPKEKWRIFYDGGKRLYEYLYRHTDGDVFRIVRRTREACLVVRDSWIEEKQNTKNLLRYDEPAMCGRKINNNKELTEITIVYEYTPLNESVDSDVDDAAIEEAHVEGSEAELIIKRVNDESIWDYMDLPPTWEILYDDASIEERGDGTYSVIVLDECLEEIARTSRVICLHEEE